MKNTYIVGLVLVIIVAVALFMFSKKQTEAPIINTEYENVAPENIEAVTTEGTTTTDSSNITTSVEVNAAGVKEFTVTGENFSFSPSLITVKKGDKVKITFKNSEGFHDFVVDEFGAATKQTKAPTTEVIEFTADKVGSFEYYCSVGSHRAMGMKGTLIVE